MSHVSSPLSTGQCATLACLLEVAAPKPGNVHRAADFADMGLQDFLASAVAIAPAMDLAVTRSVGTTVLHARRATRQVTAANTNLGILLLLAPLAAVPRHEPLDDGLPLVLNRLSVADAEDVYRAIRETNPGGLRPADGDVAAEDVRQAPTVDLRTAMRLAADRDLIAAEYAHGFPLVLQEIPQWLLDSADQFSLADRIVLAHVRLMANYPDSLIARKSGGHVAQEAAARAGAVLDAGPPMSDTFCEALADLDFWLRADGNRRNPGTSADLIAAALFVLLRDGRLKEYPVQDDQAD